MQMSDEKYEEILERHGFSESKKAALRRLKGITTGFPD
jgi:hypothetical protein